MYVVNNKLPFFLQNHVFFTYCVCELLELLCLTADNKIKQ